MPTDPGIYAIATQRQLAGLNGDIMRHMQALQAFDVALQYNAISQTNAQMGITADVTGEVGADGKQRYSNDIARKNEIQRRMFERCDQLIKQAAELETDRETTKMLLSHATRQRQDVLALMAFTAAAMQAGYSMAALPNAQTVGAD